MAPQKKAPAKRKQRTEDQPDTDGIESVASITEESPSSDREKPSKKVRTFAERFNIHEKSPEEVLGE